MRNESVIISASSQECIRIVNDEQTVLIRKTRPKLKTPFKAYLCCKNRKPYLYREANLPYDLFLDSDLYRGSDYEKRFLSGKVIGEFVCDRIDEFLVFENKSVQYWNCFDLKKSCLSYEEIADYIDANHKGYAWHISDLKIYDKPKMLTGFRKNNYNRIIDMLEASGCTELNCIVANSNSYLGDDGYCDYSLCPKLRLQKPPQIWEYAEAL